MTAHGTDTRTRNSNGNQHDSSTHHRHPSLGLGIGFGIGTGVPVQVGGSGSGSRSNNNNDDVSMTAAMLTHLFSSTATSAFGGFNVNVGVGVRQGGDDFSAGRRSNPYFVISPTAMLMGKPALISAGDRVTDSGPPARMNKTVSSMQKKKDHNIVNESSSTKDYCSHNCPHCQAATITVKTRYF